VFRSNSLGLNQLILHDSIPRFTHSLSGASYINFVLSVGPSSVTIIAVVWCALLRYYLLPFNTQHIMQHSLQLGHDWCSVELNRVGCCTNASQLNSTQLARVGHKSRTCSKMLALVELDRDVAIPCSIHSSSRVELYLIGSGTVNLSDVSI